MPGKVAQPAGGYGHGGRAYPGQISAPLAGGYGLRFWSHSKRTMNTLCNRYQGEPSTAKASLARASQGQAKPAQSKNNLEPINVALFLPARYGSLYRAAAHPVL